jgi:amino acid adenylation domain-containing protein
MVTPFKASSRPSAEAQPCPATLVELLRRRAALQGEAVGYTFLVDGEAEEESFTYSELDRQARLIAARLQELGAAGERVLLIYPPGLQYIAAFFGCLYAGAVAVPVYPPRPNRSMLRFQSVAADARPKVALTTQQVIARARAMSEGSEHLAACTWVATEELAPALAESWSEPAGLAGETLAFLQYTSGSTATPKGVMVSHGNLLHNQRIIQAACGHTERSTFVGWLPLYHDMGLIGNVLQPLFIGARCVLMSPVSFLQKPFRWLQAISRYRAFTSGGPNFAYELCARTVTAEQLATLDLSGWAIAFNGAEPVRASSMERFAEAFAPAGFRREAFFPCYGLAEATLFVSGGSETARPFIYPVEADALNRNQVVAAGVSDAAARPLVGCGQPWLDQKIVIVDPETRAECAPDRVGEIWVKGESVAGGYWGREQESEETFRARLFETGEGPFLRTGDLGFMKDGELFATGRLKDLVIIRGRNLYPQDIEWSVQQCHTALRTDFGAAFSVEAEGEERLVVVQELDARQGADPEALRESVCRAVAEAQEVQLHSLVLIKAGSLPKTSSGKVQRRATRAAYLAGELNVVARWDGAEMLGASGASVVETDDADSDAVLQSAEEILPWLVSQLAARLRVASRQIDVQQPLSHYGLDSLAAIELMHALQLRLGVSLPLAQFFLSPSIAELASEAASRLKETSALSDWPSITPSGVGSYEHLLSYGQQSLWFLHRLDPASTAYNIVVPMRLRGPLEAETFRRSLQRLVERHPSLRTTFAETGGVAVQRVAAKAEASLDVQDASGWNEEEVRRRLSEIAHTPFDLERGPLFRVSLLSRSSDEHVIVLSIHHIVSDFWSLGVLVEELGALYEAEKKGEPAELAPPALLYTDYVRWQAEILRGEEGARLSSYWQKKLGGELPQLDLPTTHARPIAQSFRGASQPFRLGPELTRRLKALAQGQGATFYMTLLAAWQVFLHRYTGQDELLVGTPTAGRPLAHLGRVTGYFVNPVVLRADLSNRPTFKTFLGRVRQTVLEAFEHQDYPFAALVEALQPQRDLSRSPLFQVMFALQKAGSQHEEALASFALGEAGARLKFGDLTFESVAVERCVAQFDLLLMMAETDGALSASLQYSTDLFDAAAVRRMVENFRTLLEGIAADPDQMISDLPLLHREEEQNLLVGWNETATAWPSAATIHSLFEAQAAKTPGSVALVAGTERLTYAELDARASRLARRLRALGIGPEVRVGVCLTRSPELVVALLGVLKAGGAYVPLDPAYPRERLAFMLSDSAAPVVLTETALLERLPQTAARRLCLDAGACEGAEISDVEYVVDDVAAAPLSSSALAYLIYTSGSTGRPKGVAIEHRNAVAMIDWAMRLFTPEQLAGVLASTSVCFDLSVFELFVPLACGGKVILSENALQLPELAAAEEVTLINTVPSAMRELVRLGGVPASVTTVNLAGEPLKGALVRQVYRQETVREVYNLYGPSEDTTYSTFALMRRDEATPLIGQPISNSRAYVLDERMRPAPVGVVGELYLGGAGVARGYLGRPALTGERFVPDPFSQEPGARLYRTGDLARRLSGGELDFLGRADHQVKVRGYRIELGEIEAALIAHGAVREAVVVVRGEAGADMRLIAYVTHEADAAGLHAGDGDSYDGTPDASSDSDLGRALKRHLARRLPEYMVPAWVCVLKALPLTPNGKIDRKALPEPFATGEVGEASEYVAPRGEMEMRIAGIWCEVLGVGRVGACDNFFELGGHSLLAMRVASRVREALGVELPLRALFECPSVSALAATLDEKRRARVEGDGVALARRPEPRSPSVLSFAQQRLWLLDQLEPGNTAYHLPAAFRLRGRLDEAALRQSLRAIVGRHESLRTTFVSVGGEPVQVVASEAEFDLRLINLEGLPARECERRVLDSIEEEALRPFDLRRGPLLRGSLLRLDAEEHVLLLSMHHIVSDGWSVGIFFKELSALYAALSSGTNAELAELPLQYADYAVWQREWLSGGELERQLAYWRAQLGGELPVLELPRDYARPARQSHRGGVERLTLSAPLVDGLRRLGRGEKATMFMTLLAGFKALLYRYTNEGRLVVGTPIAGRGRAELEGLIGCFINTLALCTEVSGALSFRELLGRVREVTLGAYAHQDLPFEKLLEELHPERDLSRTPVFQVFFNYLHYGPPRVELSGLESETLSLPEIGSKFDLTLYVEEGAQTLELTAAYNADLFAPARMAELLVQFRLLLAQAVERPDAALDEYALVTHEARELLPDPFAELDKRWEGPVHEIFSAQARRHPVRPAVIDAQGVWSYGELDARSNQLAHYLRAGGVGPQEVVAVYAHRSASLVWALLAVLKAGASFVILDPSYPAARLIACLKEARPKALLQVGASGPLQPAIEEFLPALDLRRRLELPSRARAAAEGLLADYSCESPRVPVRPEDQAYMAFTSGSTGRPKGIRGRHGSLNHFLPWLSETFGLREDDRFGMLSGLSHDPLHRDIFMPLQLGATLCIPSPEAMQTPGQLAVWMKESGITVVNLTPAIGQLLVEHADGAVESRRIESLRRAFFVGEALTRRDVSALRALAPNVECVNFYGATETQQALGYYVVPEDAYSLNVEEPPRGPLRKESLPLGRGMKDVQLLVLNRAGRLAGVGELGEVYFRSPHLALGYLNNEALTRERFLANPFTDREDDRVYRTGDLARYAPDGEVEYVGRGDQQVKIRGFRLELGEVEAALSGHEALKDVAVVARADEGEARKYLVAYVVFREGERATEGELRAHLRERVPEYMIPSAFVALEQLPLTPNGKLDRRALPAPTPRRGFDAEASRPAATPVEELLCAIWCEVLGVEALGAEENFFELGGHSLLAMRVVSRVREALGVELPLRALFECPSVSALAAALEEHLREEAPQLPPIKVVPRTTEMAVSFAQQRMWLLHRLTTARAAYNMPGAFRLRGALDVEALERTLSEVVRRHEVLRTCFAIAADGEPVQVIHTARPFPLALLDLSGLSPEIREAEVRRLMAEEAQEPFDLTQAPLLRARLLRLSDDNHILLFTMHHIVSDDWSVSVLVREVAALYAAFGEGRPSPLEELTVQYADYAAWQREWLTGEVLERQLDYWTRQLTGGSAGGQLPALELPTDRPRPAVQTFRGAMRGFELPEELSRELKRLSRREGVTLYMLLLAAFQALLYRYSGQEQLLVGTPSAGRSRKELEGLIGFFVNTLVLRGDLSGDPTFRELLERTREATLGAYAHQELPFEKLVEELVPERGAEQASLFRVWFVLHDERGTTPELPGLTLKRLGVDTQAAQFDLTLSMYEADEGIRGALKYKEDLFDANTVAEMADRFTRLLQQVADDASLRLLDIPLDEQGRQSPDYLVRGVPYASELEDQFVF